MTFRSAAIDWDHGVLRIETSDHTDQILELHIESILTLGPAVSLPVGVVGRQLSAESETSMAGE